MTMQDPTTGTGSALDLVAALERAAELLRRVAAAPAPMAAAPAPMAAVPAVAPVDFANAMRRVEAEYYDAA
jgi:hypothetical protein